MANFKCYDYLCNKCGEKTEWLVNTSDPDWDNPKDCMKCGRGKCHRAPSSPPVQKASFVDGTKRAGYEDIKQAAILEAKAAGARGEEKTGLLKEAKARKKVKR